VPAQRMPDGEHPDDVAASFGMCRSWAYKIRAEARADSQQSRNCMEHAGHSCQFISCANQFLSGVFSSINIRSQPP
jgi:hypothetical protein